MGYAATATNDSAPDLTSPREYSAFLRLRQGGAARTTWLVAETPGGSMISVGADAACDWQIRAAFVPPRAFSILVVGGRSFVRSGPEPGLLVDGKPVDDSWNPLPAQARIDIGLARFEVRSGYPDLLADEPVIELAQPRQRKEEHVGAWSQQPAPVASVALTSPVAVASAVAVASPAAVATTAVVQRHETAARTSGTRRKRTMETQEYGGALAEISRVQRVGTPASQPHATSMQERVARVQARAQERLVTPAAKPRSQAKAVRNSTIELNLDDLDYLGTIPMPRGENERTGQHVVSPSLLGADEITRVTSGAGSWRYVGIAAFFVSAYGAWLYLLDRI